MSAFRFEDERIGVQRQHMRRNDTLPGLVCQIVDEYDTPIDLTDAYVEISARRVSGSMMHNPDWTAPFTAQVTSELDGLIYYDFQPGDMAVDIGEFELVATVYDSVGNVMVSAPTAGTTYLEVSDDETWTDLASRAVSCDDVEPGDDLTREILAWCSERLAKMKTPKSIDYLDELPRDPNGKLYKRKLRDPYWEGHDRKI